MTARSVRASVYLFACLSLAGCATPMTKGSHCTVEPGYLDDEFTYAWLSSQAIKLNDETGYISPVMLAQLEQAVVNELTTKGFQQASSEAETAALKVDVSLNIRRELNAISVSDSTCTYGDCWERVDMGANTRMDIRTIGFLSVDVFHQDKPIWRGWVERPLYPKNRDNAGEIISLAVPALFESFPP